MTFSGLRGLLGKRTASETRETFWALKDVSFDVQRGQVFGIIGRNGAGKSTLLKILSRITEPTTGYADIHGRVGSLLEVGTGFHPELTGRENIYLNGTLLGMRKREIDKIFDEIVAFSEVEKFLDTPVKRYSSGMYVRLAFAVAAHLEPDILIIDEVLAVGDFRFQQKCMGKMKNVTEKGRTVLFVSHNLTVINSLCDRCLLLDGGMVEAIGPTEDITKLYFGSSHQQGGANVNYLDDAIGDQVAVLHSAQIINPSHQSIDFVQIDKPFGVKMTFEVRVGGYKLIPNFHVYTQGQCAFISAPLQEKPFVPGVYDAIMWVPGRFLNEGTYLINLGVSSVNPQRAHFREDKKFFFQVIEDIYDKHRNGYVQSIPGVVRPLMQWDVEPIQQ